MICHNEVRNFFGELTSEVCQNVALEPVLTPLDSEQFHLRTTSTDNAARLDIKAGGFWSGSLFDTTFFDVQVFNPFVVSCGAAPTLAARYRRQELMKKRQYEQRLREVEGGSFTPLVFSTTGGAGPQASQAMKRLASLLATKRDVLYSRTVAWLRCRLSFPLLRASIFCVRGA